MQRTHVAAERLAPEACDASPNFRELTVYFYKRIAAYKLLSKKKKKIYSIIRKYENDAFCIFPLGGYSKGESLTNLDNKP